MALLLPNVFTARATLLPPGSQQQSGSAAALAALGALGGLGGLGGLGAKTPDELYVALLKSDTVQRVLVERFDLATRWDLKTYEQLRREFAKYVRISSDKKSGLISVEVDDEDPAFAANFANAYADEITKLLGRLAVSEAQSRRVFFEQQLKDTKEHLIAAELGLRKVQETSGVIVLDKQAEALITGAAKVRAQIAEREVMLSVLRRSATEKNPDVQRLSAEVAALRGELARMESSTGERQGQPAGPAGEQALRGRHRVRARAARAQDSGNAARRHDPPVRDRQARRGQGRPACCSRSTWPLPPDRKSKPVRSADRARQHLARRARDERLGDLARLPQAGERSRSRGRAGLDARRTGLALAALRAAALRRYDAAPCKHAREHRAVHVAAGEHDADAAAGPAPALLQRTGQRRSTRAFGHVVRVGEKRAHRLRHLVVGDRRSRRPPRAGSWPARPRPARDTPCRRQAGS